MDNVSEMGERWQHTMHTKMQEIALHVVDDWRLYWFKDETYRERFVRFIDANMRHHLADEIAKALSAAHTSGHAAGWEKATAYCKSCRQSWVWDMSADEWKKKGTPDDKSGN